MGQLYLTNVDFLKNGVPASVIAAFVSFIQPLFRDYSPHGTIDGRIAWLCADEAYWVRIIFLCFFLLDFLPCRSTSSHCVQGGLTPQCSEYCGLGMPHSNLVGAFGLRVPSAYLAHLFNLSKHDVFRDNRE